MRLYPKPCKSRNQSKNYSPQHIRSPHPISSIYTAFRFKDVIFFPQVEAEVKLQVRQQPIIFDNSTRSLVVVEGQKVKLECYAGGHPAPTISWRRDNNALLPTGGAIYRGSVLPIDSVHKDHRGTYYCVAENGVGHGARRNIAVEVQFAPVVTATRKRVGQALQYDMDLECKVSIFVFCSC